MAMMIRISKLNEDEISKFIGVLGDNQNQVVNEIIKDYQNQVARREASFNECKKVKEQNAELQEAICALANKD